MNSGPRIPPYPSIGPRATEARSSGTGAAGMRSAGARPAIGPLAAGLALTLCIGHLMAPHPLEGAPQQSRPAAGARGLPADSAGPVVTGWVRAPGYREDGVLSGALVELRQGDRVWTVVADASGRYRLPMSRQGQGQGQGRGRGAGPGPGRVRLSVFHIAAHTLVMELLLPPSGEIQLDLELEHRPIRLAGLDVGARSLPEPALERSPFPVAEPRLAALAIRSLEASPGMVESGLVRGLGRPPPGEDHREPERVLFARGSTVDARQFLLDGAPILTPFHLAGLVPAFDSRGLEEARMYVGAAPAQYEGGLSHMLDVRSREARRDRVRAEAAVDGVAMRAGLELPLPVEGGALATGRLLHGASGFLSPGGDHPYAFGDLLLRGAIRPGDGQVLRATGFLNRETVRLEEMKEVSWGNRAASLGWSARWGETRTEAVAARSHYRATLPVEWPESVLAQSAALQTRGSFLVRAPWGEGELTVGASVDRQEYGYRLDRIPVRDADDGTEVTGGPATTQIEGAPQRLRGDRVGVFAEVDRSVAPGVRIQAGGRTDHFGVDGRTRVSPRASVRVLLNDDALLTLSGGRYHQQIPVPGLVARTGGNAFPAIFWEPTLAVASATHLVLSLDQALSPETGLGVSGFIKHFEGVGEGAGSRVNASGTDLRVSREGERLEGWVGYAISWFWVPSRSGEASSFTGRHLLTTGARFRPSEDFELGLSLGYGAGLPLTEVTPILGVPDVPPTSTESYRSLDAKSNVDRLVASAGGAPLELAAEEAFLRLDLEASWVARPRIRGHATEFRPYLRVLNALDRRDALFHYFDRWMEDGLRPLAERPFLPLVGVEWRF